MRTQEIQYQDDDYNVVITVQQSTVRTGLRRSAIINKFYADERERRKGGSSPTPWPNAAVATITYPAAIAATVTVVNKEGSKKALPPEPTPEEWLDLPESLTFLWEQAALALNPHWLPQPVADDSGEAPKPAVTESTETKTEKPATVAS